MGALLVAFACAGNAAAVEPKDQYKAYLTKAQVVEPISTFGEQVSLRDGRLGFRMADVEVPGIGPTIRIVRSAMLDDGLATSVTSGNRLGGWEIEIPRLKTVTARPRGHAFAAPVHPGSPDGWQVSGVDEDARCTGFSPPADVTYAGSSVEFPASQWWFGYQLVDAVGEEHAVFRRASSLPRPEYEIGTSNHWVIGCLPRTANGMPGEAFLAVAPDGTKYWFDHLVYTAYDALVTEHDMGSRGMLGFDLPRQAASMLVTRVEDRFGNVLRYAYDAAGTLRSIDASDGRVVSLAYDAAGFNLTVGGGALTRTWRYTQDEAGGLRVTLPDGSAWRYAGNFGAQFFSHNAFDGCSQLYSTLPSGSRQVSVTAPSGASTTFVLDRRMFGRSHVPKNCIGASQMNPDGGYSAIPRRWIGYALTSKTVTGPGLAPQVWRYSYAPHVASWKQDCDAGAACIDTGWTEVLGPGGERVRSHFSTRWDQTENKLVKEETFGADGRLVRTVDYAYATAPSTGPTNPYAFPLKLGASFSTWNANDEVVQRWTPLVRRTITQQGREFVWEVDAGCDGFSRCFDALARPAQVTRASGPPGAAAVFTRTDAITHADHFALWVLGQQASSTYLGQGAGPDLVESRTEYDDATALPVATHAFGKLRQTLRYHPDGMLASVSDGRDAADFDTTIRLADWYRGIPKSITFPDGNSRSAEVDDLGQLTSVKDEVGAKTCYAYDAMGKVSRITYPSEDVLGECDTGKWAPTTINFSGGHPAAYGMPAGHWRQTTTTGNGRKVLVFDALWRPVVEQRMDLADPANTTSETIRRFDADGRTVFESYAMKSAGTAVFADTALKGTRMTYDALGRPTRVEQDSEYPAPLVTTYEYLANFATRVTVPGGQQTTTYFQTFDQPGTDQPRAIAHPEGAVTDIPRDVFGKPQYITRRTDDWSTALTRWYTYNAAQELCRTSEPETGVTLMGYDLAGNLAWSAAGLATGTPCDDLSQATLDRKSTRTYDNRNRLVELEFGDDIGEQAWTYTPDGLPATVWTYNGENRTQGVHNAYVYNHRRLPTGESMHLPGAYTWSLGYGYDRNGFPAAQTAPDTSSYLYAVDALGRTTGITGTSGTYVSGATYHPNGALKQFTYGNGIVHTLTQNVRGLPDRRLDVHAGSTAVLDDSYDYDFNGNVAAISDGRPGGHGNRAMAYDGLDRLASVTSPMFNGTIRYTYDVLDNIATLVAPRNRDRDARDWRYCYQSNRLAFIRSGAGDCATGSASMALAFDVQGNVRRRNEQEFAFSQDNRLRAAVGKETYRYDAHGRRVMSESPTLGAIRSYYNRGGQLAFQQDLRQGRNLAHVYLAGSLVATREQPSAGGPALLKFHHNDALGSPIAVTGIGRNEIRARSEYEPYGEVINRPARDRPGYTGHVEDGETGLTYMQQRYYDAVVGRSLSVDPVTSLDSNDVRFFARYGNAFNNPYRFTDPDGRAPLGANVLKMRAASDSFIGISSSFRSPQDFGALPSATVKEGSSGGNVQLRSGVALANGKIKEDLEFLSQQVGGRAIDVISGRRTQNAQDRLRKDFNERAAKRSQHTYGVAADIKIPGLSKPEVAKAAFDTGRFERVNLYTDPVAGIHVDYLDVGPGTQMHIDWMRVDP